MADEEHNPEDRKAYLLGYSRGYTTRGQRYIAINRAEVAEQVRAVIGDRDHVNFDAPHGRRLTLLIPKDMTADELAHFREVVTPYLDLLAKRLKEKEATGGLSPQVGDKGDGNAHT